MTIRNWRFGLVGAGLLATVVVAGQAFAAGGGHTATPQINPGGRMVVAPGVKIAHNAKGNAPQTSQNWAGYAASGSTYKTISADWTEPTATCNGGTTASSFWVGLDGVTSTSVEQTGSEVDCNGGTPSYSAWHEIFPAASINFSDPVKPGDHFHGVVTFNGGSSYTLTLADTTQGWSHSLKETLAGAANSSAEAIAEAPSDQNGIIPLTNFGTANFTNVLVDGTPIGSTTPAPIQIDQTSAAGQTLDSVSALSGNDAFTATFQGSGGGGGSGAATAPAGSGAPTGTAPAATGSGAATAPGGTTAPAGSGAGSGSGS